MSDVHFEVISYLNKRVMVTNNRWNLIVTIKHTNMTGKEELVKASLIHPDEIRKSSKDKEVFIYYKRVRHHFVAVVCKHLNEEGTIITTYITDRIKSGEIVWQRQE